MDTESDQTKFANYNWLIAIYCYLPVLLYLLAWGITILAVWTNLASPAWAMPLNMLFYASAISTYIVVPSSFLFLIYAIVQRKIVMLLITIPSLVVNLLPLYVVLYRNGGYMITA